MVFKSNYLFLISGLPADQVAKFLEFKPSSKLVLNGDTYTYISTTAEGTKETSFKSGVEFDDKIQDKIPVNIRVFIILRSFG